MGRLLVFLSAVVAQTPIACSFDMVDEGPSLLATGQKSDRSDDGQSSLGAFNLTGSFDGSQNFTTWTESLEVARRIKQRTGNPVHFSYFLSGAMHYRYHCRDFDNGSCNYGIFPPEPAGTKVSLPAARRCAAAGCAVNNDEITVRNALVQQAINEGHDIGSHGMFHDSADLLNWSQWDYENDFRLMNELASLAFFEPVLDADGNAVFPAWVARSTVEGELGAVCAEDEDCHSGRCVPVTDQMRYCSRACHRDAPCPPGFACGGPDWGPGYWDQIMKRRLADICLPLPEFPVTYTPPGSTTPIVLFDEDRRPNAEAIQRGILKPYRMVGWRAPYLAMNKPTMMRAMANSGFTYDASQVTSSKGNTSIEDSSGAWEFGLFSLHPELLDAKNHPLWPIPFEDEYYRFGYSVDEMEAQYKETVLALYARRATVPGWSIAKHFTLWLRDRQDPPQPYARVFYSTFEWAASGCPEEGRTEDRCPELSCLSFREMAEQLPGVIDTDPIE